MELIWTCSRRQQVPSLSALSTLLICLQVLERWFNCRCSQSRVRETTQHHSIASTEYTFLHLSIFSRKWTQFYIRKYIVSPVISVGMKNEIAERNDCDCTRVYARWTCRIMNNDLNPIHKLLLSCWVFLKSSEVSDRRQTRKSYTSVETPQRKRTFNVGNEYSTIILKCEFKNYVWRWQRIELHPCKAQCWDFVNTVNS
jgi:hypothetical protein